MRTTMQALLALGFVGAMAVSATAPASAQSADLYFRGPGVGVDVQVGRRPYRHHRWYDRDRDRDDYRYGYRPYYGRYNTWSYGNYPNNYGNREERY